MKRRQGPQQARPGSRTDAPRGLRPSGDFPQRTRSLSTSQVHQSNPATVRKLPKSLGSFQGCSVLSKLFPPIFAYFNNGRISGGRGGGMLLFNVVTDFTALDFLGTKEAT